MWRNLALQQITTTRHFELSQIKTKSNVLHWANKNTLT